MQEESLVNLPPLGASLELISCATGLKFEYVAVTVFGTLEYRLFFLFIRRKFNGLAHICAQSIFNKG